ncbi:MAG: hypothetical protein ACXVMS_16390 [Flavisolibacter sp.]
MTRKTGIGSILLLGAAAFGAYKYYQMTDQQKKDLLNKGKKLVNENLGDLGKIFSKKDARAVSHATA